MLRNLSGADVVGPVQDPWSRMCSRLMLWNGCKADIVERVRGLWCETCSGPVTWDAFKAQVDERVGAPVVERVGRVTMQIS